ncbi:hypothetical protein B0J15DRAFT_531726 [Fusarium solani]|uniref:Uncharacterized protein n=1 Tax=Fusarium solani TaxID=169388 RepID=A0A9P9L3M5_FUSSL|nr:uncharacterized protein B0J15DRAFT_531726 [Fusarium solani]KAH7273417.1 hypothetical protein B0J15DRAFT_531726 [Fusarium solani]
MASDPGRQRQALTAWEYPIQYDPIFTATLGAHSRLPPQPDPADSDDAAQNYPSRRATYPSVPFYLFRTESSLERHRGKSLVATSQGLSRSSLSPLPRITATEYRPPLSVDCPDCLASPRFPFIEYHGKADVTPFASGVGQSVGRMSFTSSPPEDVTDLFRRRNLTNIPRDQKELLEDSDSWAVDLKNTPHGLAHVPGHVLQTVKEAYTAQKAAIDNSTPKSRKRNGSVVASTSSKRMRNGITNTPREDSEESAQSSPEREISWGPSPTRPGPSKSIHVAINTTTVQSSMIQETPKAARDPPPKRPCPSEPSEDESDNELETEIPQGMPQPGAPVNRTAARLEPTAPFPMPISSKPMATPPCAQPSNPTQPIIPNTVVAPRETCQELAATKKRQSRRIFKGINVGDTEKKVHHMPNRLPATKTFATVESSIPTSSDSIIPATATLKATATQDSVIQSIEENESDHDGNESMRSDDEPPVAGPSNQEGESIMQSIEAPKVHQSAKTPMKRSSQKPVAAQQSDAQPQVETSPVQVNGRQGSQSKVCPPLCIGPSASKEPYEVFLHHYPLFAEDDWGRKEAGTKMSFVIACVYLNWLRRRKKLRDYLYDDFIRAFTEDYKEYVESAKDKQKTLVAIEWFNKLSEKPTYSQYVVNRGNLSFILKSYPEEVAKASMTMMKADDISIYTSSDHESESDNDDDVVSNPSAPSDKVSQRWRNKGAVIQGLGQVRAEAKGDGSAGTTVCFQASKAHRESATTIFIASPGNPNPVATTGLIASPRDSDSGSCPALTSDPQNVHGAAVYHRDAIYKIAGASDVAVL